MSEELVASLEHYLPQLVRLAERNIGSRLSGKVEAEDVVSSVCRTFIRRYGHDAFHIDREDDLWRLLVTITLNKTRNKARHFLAAKRDVSQHVALNQDDLALALRFGPGPDEAVAFADLLTALRARLDDVGSQVLQLLLEGESQVAIAEQLNIATRTVSRKLKIIRDKLGDLSRD